MSIQTTVLDIQIRFASDIPPPKKEMLNLLVKLFDLEMDLDILSTTRVGRTVNLIRAKNKDQEIRDMAEQVILKWMQLLPPENPEERPGTKIVMTLESYNEAIGNRTL